MSNLFQRHSDEDLVRYLDGELSARQSAKVASHLESCAQCRAELDELKATLAECVRYQEVRKAQSPEAPQEWRDLYRDFSRIDESLATESLLVRLTRPLVHAGAPRWSFVAGLAVLIVLLSLNQLRQAPSVQAASLLKKAEQIAESKPRAARRIRVRTSRRQDLTRPMVVAASDEVAELQAVGTMLQAAHFDWNDPLSAHAFEQWRDQQVQKTDEISKPSANLTRIRTAAASGDLADASITFDTADYRPVEERLEFRDREWIELSEIAETFTESVDGTVAAHVEVPVRAAELPSRPAAFAPGPSASISDELQVLSALSAIEADLGDAVDYALADGKVVVTGDGAIPARRQRQIRESLANLPRVQVEFTQLKSPVAMPDAAVTSSGAAGPTASPLQARLQKQLGGHAEFDRFSSQFLDLDDVAMQRVYALHRLAQKFSAEDEARLSPKDAEILHEISRKYTTFLAEKVNVMDHMLVPTLNSLGGTLAAVHPAAHTAWQPAAEDVYTNARRVEQLASQMLGMTPAAGSANKLPSDLLTALKELQASLDDCQGLVAR